MKQYDAVALYIDCNFTTFDSVMFNRQFRAYFVRHLPVETKPGTTIRIILSAKTTVVARPLQMNKMYLCAPIFLNHSDIGVILVSIETNISYSKMISLFDGRQNSC